jgi:hypothetical protein
MAKVSKINKKQINEYRNCVKLRMMIAKGLKFINEKIAFREMYFQESVKEFGPQIIDGFIAEMTTSPGKTGVEYKAAFMEAYKLLTPANQKKMDKFLASVTKDPVKREYVSIIDTNLSYFEGTLKSQDAAVYAKQLEEGVSQCE